MRRCTESGCDRVVKARGLCAMHYRRWRLDHQPTPISTHVGATSDPVLPEGYLSAAQVLARVPDLTYRQLYYLVSRGHIETVSDGRGSGHHYWYHEADIERLRQMARVLGAIKRLGVLESIASGRIAPGPTLDTEEPS